VPANVKKSGARIAFDVGTRHYAAWAPSSCNWTASGRTLSTDLGSAGYLSIAVLPDNTSSTLAAFDAHAYAFVTDTRVSWSLDTVSGRVLTDFVTTTTAKEGSNTVPLVGLYPHQWRRAVGLASLGPSYPTARGALELSATNSFRTSAPLPAIFPIVPFAAPRNAHYRASRLDSLLTVWSSKSDAALVRRNADTYWTGKDLGRLVQLMELASAAGDTVQRDRFLTLLRTRLEGWLTYTSGKSAEYFAHEPAWGTLLGASTSYGSGEELNDHHFHYGYFLMAAAAVAAHVPGWGDSTAWGGMVDLVAKDVANPQRNQAFSPFLRNFDPYEGHSWASGHANFGDGNNEESSSEAIDFSAGLALWGESSGNRALRDLGTWMYATESDATREYWFDVHGDNFPSSWTHDVAGMIWGGKADHATWFSGEPEDIHGINWLPVTGGSLYLGLDSAAAKANHDEMVAEKSGSLGIWLDIVWEQQAFFAPENAWTSFDAASATYTPEDGESQAHTMAHILSLGVLGREDTAVHGDIPSSAVFRNASAVDHVAWNPTSTPRVVSFTDGQKLTVAPRSWAWSDGSTSLSTAKSRPASLESALYDIRGRHRASGTASGIGLSTNGSKAQVR
jgi:endoglucanase Acf2